jgi:hypothetical protein
VLDFWNSYATRNEFPCTRSIASHAILHRDPADQRRPLRRHARRHAAVTAAPSTCGRRGTRVRAAPGNQPTIPSGLPSPPARSMGPLNARASGPLPRAPGRAVSPLSRKKTHPSLRAPTFGGRAGRELWCQRWPTRQPAHRVAACGPRVAGRETRRYTSPNREMRMEGRNGPMAGVLLHRSPYTLMKTRVYEKRGQAIFTRLRE